MTSWDDLKKIYGPQKYYERIVHRHIDFKRGKQVTENLEIFINEVIGQKYDIGGEKLMRSSTIAKFNDNKKFIDSDRTFFCSELQAKAYKVFGIIEDDDISCTQYYPIHFSSKGDEMLKLTRGTFLNEECQIVLDQ